MDASFAHRACAGGQGCIARGQEEPLPSLARPAQSARCPLARVPSPTLSPTHPVPRGLLTLCPAASSGPYLQTALPCYVRLAVLFICLCPSLCVYVYAYAYAYVYVYVRVYLHVNTYVYTCISCILHLRLAHASCCTMSYLTIHIYLSLSYRYIYTYMYIFVCICHGGAAAN